MKSKLWNTRNTLPEEIRAEAIGLLNQQLADAFDLNLQAKQAHWNVKGVNFIALHELFDSVQSAVEEFADELAERAVALGGTAFGTLQAASSLSRLAEYPLAADSSRKHVTALSIALAAFGRTARAAIDTATQLGDANTADLFTEVSRNTDMLLWKVEAHAYGAD